jgi:hypothetical protein
VQQQQLDRIAEMKEPELVGRQAVHVGEHGGVVGDEGDDRGAEWPAPGPALGSM